MAKINAYIGFNGKCREAMNFYKECFGGELFFQGVEGTPMEKECPPAMKDQILHSSLTNDTLVIMGTDMQGQQHVVGTNISLQVTCESMDELQKIFDYLSSNGKVIEGLKKQFWGDVFGALIDKFGITWMMTWSDK
jgi:PhnB protein